MRNERVLSRTQMAMFIAIMLIMYQFPFLGYLPLGFMNATLMHIPVILGAVLLGPKKGAFLGGIFGLTSLFKATFQPMVTSFVFSPFYSIGEVHGNFASLLICFVPRILIGITSYYIYRFLVERVKGKKASFVALVGAGLVGSLTNTILVMNFIYLFFGKAYANVIGTAYPVLYRAILSVIFINGIPEALIAAILVTAIGKILLRLNKSSILTK